MNEKLEEFKMLVAVVIYAALTWIWFDLNDTNSLPIIGHTAFVRGVGSNGIFVDMIYFSISTAVMIIIANYILSQIPIIHFDGAIVPGASCFVNLAVLLYEFHILEFRFRFIGLSLGLIIFYTIGMLIGWRIWEKLDKIFNIVNVVDDVTNSDK